MLKKLISNNTEDKHLWLGFKNGDSNCFNTMFRKFYSELYCYGMKIHPDPEFVKDSIQEVFVRIWETRERLGLAENIKSYLIVSLKRMMLMKLGKDKSKLHVEFGKVDQSLFTFEIYKYEKQDEIPPEIKTILLNSINSMTKRQRELIMLFFYHNLPYNEISKVMNISVQATRNLMYRTLTHLRESIGEKSLKSMKNIFLPLFTPFQ